MKRLLICVILVVLTSACSRLPPLTPQILTEAREKWETHKPQTYKLVIEMSGDRVETGRFEVEVRSGKVISLRRNGLVISAAAGDEYTMDGLFHTLTQELGLAEKPAMLGAAPGYAVYTTAKFDDVSGRLMQYRRIVGGTSNSIEIDVLKYSGN